MRVKITDGIINVYKEAGYTSHDVVARLRGILKQKKIGHTGTLDPDAEGVLPVCLGKATKVCGMLSDATKEYRATFILGIETDTQDMSGNIVNQCDVKVDDKEIRAVIAEFVGDIKQIPPMYSALKVNGKKLYEYARAGIDIERKARNITIYSIDIVDISLPEITIDVVCSKGTYIRTLCHDIGKTAGCGAAMKSLLRTRVFKFDIHDSVKIDDVEKYAKSGTVEKIVMQVDCVFDNLPMAAALKDYSKPLYNGSPIKREWFKDDKDLYPRIRVYDHRNIFVGIYNWDNEKQCYKPEKIFYRNES